MNKVYLAGAIKGQTYDGCTYWRDYAKQKLSEWSIIGVSPMRAKEHLSKYEVISDQYQDVMCCSRGIITRDRYDLMNCDIILANLLGLESISIGTVGEFFWADAFRKPVIAVMEKKGNPHDHIMIQEIVGFRVETLDEGLLVAKNILNC